MTEKAARLGPLFGSLICDIHDVVRNEERIPPGTSMSVDLAMELTALQVKKTTSGWAIFKKTVTSKDSNLSVKLATRIEVEK